MTIKKAERTNQLPQMDTLAARVRYAREQKGFTQEELAKAAKTSQQVIAKIENEQTKRPRNIEVIAHALEQSPAWLQFGDADIDKLDRKALDRAMALAELNSADQELIDQFIEAVRQARKTYSKKHQK